MSAGNNAETFVSFLRLHHLELNQHPTKGRALNATKPLPRGTHVLSFPALATVAVDDCCHWCLKPAIEPTTTPKQPRCSACQRAKYCGAECQKRDWKAGHKVLCPFWKKRGTTESEDEAEWTARKDEEMLVKVALALTDSKSLSEDLRGGAVNREAFLSLPSHSEKWDTETKSQMSQIAHQVAGMKSITLPEAELKDHLGRFRCNNFAIYDPQLFIRAEGAFPIGALINHSCHPNCLVAYEGRTQVVRTIRDVDVGEELVATYVDVMESRDERRKKLWDKYRFHCDCPRCGPVDSSVTEAKPCSFYMADMLLYANISPCSDTLVESWLDGQQKLPFPSLFPPKLIFNDSVTTIPPPPSDISTSIHSFISYILTSTPPSFILSASDKTYASHHSDLLTALTANQSSPTSNPPPPWTMPLYTPLSRLLYASLDNGQWHRASLLALYVLAIYIIAYDRFHPMASLQWSLAGKCLWNFAEGVQDGTGREVVRWSWVCLETARACLKVSHGEEKGELSDMVRDVEEVMGLVREEM
ncbi:SET and MYND domain-containing protein 3 [Rhizophlyctis rosea]|nr:SET and MYND domain-containing protein 3 [Rhizophlyctis rosea]